MNDLFKPNPRTNRREASEVFVLINNLIYGYNKKRLGWQWAVRLSPKAKEYLNSIDFTSGEYKLVKTTDHMFTRGRAQIKQYSGWNLSRTPEQETAVQKLWAEAPQAKIAAEKTDYNTVRERRLELFAKFIELADAQRGAPEEAMLRIQHDPLGAGVYGYACEHTGDLTHRMNERVAIVWGTFGYDSVKNKAEKVLRSFEQGYGFEREMQGNLKNNYEYHAKGALKGVSFGEAVTNFRKKCQAYANAHGALKVYNRPQELARDAAVALGKWQFGLATEKLSALLAVIEAGSEVWVAEASQGSSAPKTAKSGPHKNASTQINLPPDAAVKVVEASMRVAEEDLGADGREDEPHITIKYGVKDDVALLSQVIGSQQPFNVSLGKTHVFEAGEISAGQSPIVVEAHAPELKALHDAVNEAMSTHKDDFDYNPHVTLAYVKPATAQKYDKLDWAEGVSFPVNGIVLSTKSGARITVPFGNPKNASHKTPPMSDTQYEPSGEYGQGQETNAYANIPERVKGEEDLPSLEKLSPAMFKTAELYGDCNVSTPDQLPSPEEFAKEHGENRRNNYTHLREFFNRFTSPLTIYRALKMAGPKPTPYPKGFGIYWSWNEDKAIPYEGETEPEDQTYGQTFIFRAEVPLEAVDWAGTVGANMDNSMEEEITLHKGTPINIVGWRHRDKTKWQSPTNFMRNVTAAKFVPPSLKDFYRQKMGQPLPRSKNERMHLEMLYDEAIGQVETLEFPLTVHRALEVPKGEQPNLELTASKFAYVPYELYHGTCGSIARKVLEEGLKSDPQKSGGVYAAEKKNFALDYARTCARHADDLQYAIIVLDGDKALKAGLEPRPDLGEGFFGSFGIIPPSVIRRIVFYDANTDKVVETKKLAYADQSANLPLRGQKGIGGQDFPVLEEEEVFPKAAGASTQLLPDEVDLVPEFAQNTGGGKAVPKLEREPLFPEEKEAAAKPKYLYHGTSEKNLPDIQKNGLKAGLSEQHTEWGPSVYLACDKATAQSYERTNAGNWIILQIDLSKLNKELLRPDDWEFRDVWTAGEVPHSEKVKYGDNWANVPWQISLQYSCQVAYLGDIPAAAIKLVSSPRPFGVEPLDVQQKKFLDAHTVEEVAEHFAITPEAAAKAKAEGVVKTGSISKTAEYGAEDIVYEYAQAMKDPVKNKNYRQKWSVVPATRIQKIWSDYMKVGFVQDEKGMEAISKQILQNIYKLEVNTILTAHTGESPERYGEDILGVDKLPDGYFEVLESFFDDDNGAWRLSDYALGPLLTEARKLEEEFDPNEQLQIVDRILNIVHARSDLASWFVQGGRASLNKIFGGKSKRRASVDFPSFQAWVKKNGGIAKILGSYDVDTAETYGYGLEEPDNPAAAKRYEKELLKRAFADFQERYENLIAEYQNWNFPMDVYRCISLPRGDKPSRGISGKPKGQVPQQQHLFPGTPQAEYQQALEMIQYEGVGIYWSWDENSAECHWGTGGPSVTLHGVINKSNVDWEGTLYANMFPSLGDEEKEVRLIEGTQFELEGIQYDEKTWSQPPVRTVTAAGRKRQFYYHATKAENLDSIAKRGLKPSEDPQWGGQLGDQSLGKVFFAANPRAAMYYAMIVFHDTLESSGGASIPVCLRVRVPENIPVVTGNPDERRIEAPVTPGQEFEEAWATQVIPPENIEVYWHKWQPLKAGNWDEMSIHWRDPEDWEIEQSAEHGEVEVNGYYEDWEGDMIGDSVSEAVDEVESFTMPKTAKGKKVGEVYLLHFDIDPKAEVPASREDASKPFHARHYLGWAENAQVRINQHYQAQSGVKLIDAIHAKGITFTVANVWTKKTREFERRLKNQGGLSRHCPICKKLGIDRDTLSKKKIKMQEQEQQVVPATPEAGPDFVEVQKTTKTAYLPQEVGWLKDYLTMNDQQQAVDLAYKWPQDFIEYVEGTEDADKLPQGDDPETVQEEVLNTDFSQFSGETMGGWRESQINNLMQYNASDAPSWATLSYEGVVKNQWLIHFTDDPNGIAANGFKYGMDDMDRVALSTWFSDKSKEMGGYNFAYLLGDFVRYGEVRGGGSPKYGKHAVIFRASGIKVWHSGDDEPQIIFRGSEARDIMPIYHEYSAWQLPEDSKGKPIYQSDDLSDVTTWVVNNWAQYQKALRGEYDKTVSKGKQPKPKPPKQELSWDEQGVIKPAVAFKTAAEPWEMREDEYAPGRLTEDMTDEQFRERSQKRHDWEQSSLAAISLGKMTPEQAKERGAYNVGTFKPLPATLYHVTTAKSRIESEGIKTRWELRQGLGAGLGGGTDKSISFTSDYNIAKGIYDNLLIARKVASGEMTLQKLIDTATKGTGANKPWIKDIVRSLGGTTIEGTDKSIELDSLERGVVYTHTMGDTPKPTDIGYKPGNWRPTPWTYHWKGGDGKERYSNWERDLTSQEKQEATFEFFKKWSFWREQAGGGLDPLYFMSDPAALGRTPESEIAILQFKPVPGAVGTQESALGEWRTYTGQAVQLVKGMAATAATVRTSSDIVKESSEIAKFAFYIEVPASSRGHFWDEPPAHNQEFWAFKGRPSVLPNEKVYFTFNKVPVAETTCLRVEKPGQSKCELSGKYEKHWKLYWEPAQFVKYAGATVTLYHGTCPESAAVLLEDGWTPNSGSVGGNVGQAKYLYLTTEPGDARWFANEKGCDTILMLRDVPVSVLAVDPEDGTEDTVREELNKSTGLPGKVVLTKPLAANHFSVLMGKVARAPSKWYHGTSAQNAERILKDGFLRPDQETTYDIDIPRDRAVYIADYDVAYQYAQERTRGDDKGVVLEVARPDWGKLLPDEDDVYELLNSRGSDLSVKGSALARRVKALWLQQENEENQTNRDFYGEPEKFPIYETFEEAWKAWGEIEFEGSAELGEQMKYLTDYIVKHDPQLARAIIELVGKAAHMGPIKILRQVKTAAAIPTHATLKWEHDEIIHLSGRLRTSEPAVADSVAGRQQSMLEALLTHCREYLRSSRRKDKKYLAEMLNDTEKELVQAREYYRTYHGREIRSDYTIQKAIQFQEGALISLHRFIDENTPSPSEQKTSAEQSRLPLPTLEQLVDTYEGDISNEDKKSYDWWVHHHNIETRFPLTLYRIIGVTGPAEIRWDKIGTFWSLSEAGAYRGAVGTGDFGNDAVLYCIKATVESPQDVDWYETLRANIIFGEGESEITLRPGQSLRLVDARSTPRGHRRGDVVITSWTRVFSVRAPTSG